MKNLAFFWWRKIAHFWGEKNSPEMAVRLWGTTCIACIHVHCLTAIPQLFSFSQKNLSFLLIFLLTHFHFQGRVCMFVSLTEKKLLENWHIVLYHLITKDVSNLLRVFIFFWNAGSHFCCRFFLSLIHTVGKCEVYERENLTSWF